jgi:hypothetical protein
MQAMGYGFVTVPELHEIKNASPAKWNGSNSPNQWVPCRVPSAEPLWDDFEGKFAPKLKDDAFFLSLSPADGTPNLLVAGDTFTMEVLIENPSGRSIGSISDLAVEFNAGELEPVAAAAGAMSTDKVLSLNPCGSGARFNFDSEEDYDDDTDGILLSLNFKAKTGLVLNNLDLTLTVGAISDFADNLLVAGADYLLDSSFGGDNVSYGDIDGDGVITSADVTMLRRFLAFTEPNPGPAITEETRAAAFKLENDSFVHKNALVAGGIEVTAQDITLLRRWIASQAGGNLR